MVKATIPDLTPGITSSSLVRSTNSPDQPIPLRKRRDCVWGDVLCYYLLTMLQYLVILGALVSLAGCLSYAYETIKGRTKPNRVSWLLWGIAPLIATAAGLASGVTWAALPVFMSGFGPLLIFFSSFSNTSSYWKLEKFDYLCGLFSFLALILWLITKDANIAITFAILSDAAAAIPTLKKAWQNADTETYWPYIGGLFSVATAFFAVQFWDFSSLAFPVYLVAINLVLILAIARGNRLRKN